MKKIIFSTLLLTFALSSHAQYIQPEENPEPQDMLHVLTPKEKPMKKDYEAAGWIYSYQYLNYLLPNSYTLTRSLSVLTPDSCLLHVNNKMGDLSVFSAWMHAIGNSFDPYSESYDRMFATGLLPTPQGDGSIETYPYRIDTLLVRGVYYWGERDGYNAASPDTLRFYLSYHHTYQWEGKNTEWKALHWTSDVNYDTALFSPMVKVDTVMAAQSKGNALSPAASNCITIDYVLTEKDSTYYWDSINPNTGDTSRWYRYTNIELPLTLNGATQNGFEVPAGAVTSMIVKFIPGYDYQLGDTIIYGDLNENNVYMSGYPRYSHNCFRIMTYYEGTVGKAFCDPWGYNFNFYEHKTQRYQTASALYNTMYWPTATRVPFLAFHISCDEDAAVTVIDSNIASGVTERENIIAGIWPNPAHDVVTVKLKNDRPATITLFNTMGQAVKSMHSTQAETEINIRDISAGIYLVRVEQEGIRVSGKLVIQ